MTIFSGFDERRENPKVREVWFRWFSDFSGFQFGDFWGSMLIFRGVTIAYHYWPVKIANQACPPRAVWPCWQKRNFGKVFVEAPRNNRECVDFENASISNLSFAPTFLDMILGKPKGEFPQMVWKVSESSSNDASLFNFGNYILVKVDGSTPKFGGNFFVRGHDETSQDLMGLGISILFISRW